MRMSKCHVCDGTVMKDTTAHLLICPMCYLWKLEMMMLALAKEKQKMVTDDFRKRRDQAGS